MAVNRLGRRDYPLAFMRKSTTPTDYVLARGIWAEPVIPSNEGVTDRDVDRYHSMLLNSANPENNLLGTLSIVGEFLHHARPRARQPI